MYINIFIIYIPSTYIYKYRYIIYIYIHIAWPDLLCMWLQAYAAYASIATQCEVKVQAYTLHWVALVLGQQQQA